MQYKLQRPVINGKQSATWYICWTEGRRSCRKSTRTADLRQAERVLTKFLAALTAPPERFNMSQLFEAYATERTQDNIRSPETLRWHLKRPNEVFGDLHPNDLSRPLIRDTIEDWREEGTSDSTINKRLRLVRASLNWAVREDWIDNAPYIPAPAQAKPRTRYLTREEFQALYMATDEPHVKAFLALGVWSGHRMSAILSLTWGQLADGFVRPTGGHENKRRAVVPINAPLALSLGTAYAIRDSDYVISWRGEPITSIKTAFYKAVNRAGLEDVRIHDLRRTCATWLAQKGVKMELIAAYLGDGQRTVDLHYAHLSPDYLVKASESIA